MISLILASQLAMAKPNKTVATEDTLRHLRQALDVYYMDCGHFPTTEEGLSALRTPSRDCERWGPEPYLTEIPVDAWGYMFEYQRIGHGYEMISRGADGREGGVGPDFDLRVRVK